MINNNTKLLTKIQKKIQKFQNVMSGLTVGSRETKVCRSVGLV